MGADAEASISGANGAGRNPLDIIPGNDFLPFHWRCLGGVLNSPASTTVPSLSSRITFVARRGFDPLEEAPAGRILEGNAKFGMAIKSQGLALALTTSNVNWRTGVDDPLHSQVVGDAAVPSVKATVAARLCDECHVAGSWDLKLKRPELSVAWTGSTFTERATALAAIDPIGRSLRVAAAISAPGPEWRKDLYDVDEDAVEAPVDDGARHSLYVDHTALRGDLLHRTTLGARLDLGRLLNLVAAVVDERLQDKVPKLVWRVPLMTQLYGLIVPPEDENQIRHRMRGWELDISTELGSAAAAADLAADDLEGLKAGALGSLGRPAVVLRKRTSLATLAARYDVMDHTATASASCRGLTIGAVVRRPESRQSWASPALLLQIEPLSLL